MQNRLQRVRGQLESVCDAIADGRDCAEVIPQLLAIRGAVNASLNVYIEQSLDSCVADTDTQKMKQLIKTLIKNA